ncbi:hypothetical protein COU01_01070 [Candidatus Falkowbacteria bacterium CG10_big_fil_rev_8_21_14_0_10_44_15]|uniref:Uncharacterized protein n=1 Tax=Candidatus Falkowbacteria bacterium CG10_big_fil_rev_8_21_14_0_10_44_15 TaxID=1974569 RepID=A0A2H0V0E8_9BACT|nr:MAG: hypothetical protein COU01_01070 [Candidatus Falkowbacteria bacterium CG10_big_fil_rev_8_21_14_0_10_44_15]
MDMDRSAHLEKKSTRLSYGEAIIGDDKRIDFDKPLKQKKAKTLTGEEIPTERFRGFIATHELQPVTGEQAEVSELYFTFRETGSRVALYKLIEIKIKSLRALADDRVALTDEELKPVLDLIEWCPGGKELSKEQLTKEVKQVAVDIYNRELSGKGEKGLTEAGEFWDRLCVQTLDRNGAIRLSQEHREKLEKSIDKDLKEREDLDDVAELYHFLVAHGVDPQTLRLSDILRENLMENKHEDWYKKLVGEEDGRDKGLGLAKREGKENDYLAVNPREYWREKLLIAVEGRLGEMRSSVVAYLDKSGERQKLNIGRGGVETDARGLETALAYESVAGEKVLGQFLDQMNKGGYWRGKALLDVLYWKFYRGQLVGNVESMSDNVIPDSMAKRDEINVTLRQYSGEVAISNMEKDERFIYALKTLYFFNQGKSYEYKLEVLAQKYNFDANGELPQFIVDAVMFEKVYVLDALNMSRGDLRILAYHPAQIFDKEIVTDADGHTLEFLGENMRFTESPMMKMGWWDTSNDRFNYEAMVPDTREFNPEKYWDQKDKIWQHCFMYLLEANDRSHDLVRKYANTEERILFMPELTPDNLNRAREIAQKNKISIEEALRQMAEPMTDTPGQAGDYLNYQNTRYKIKRGQKPDQGEYDHRRGVFDRIKWVLDEDMRLLGEGKQGKAGLNDRLNPDDQRSLTVRQAMQNFVNFLSLDLSGTRSLRLDGINIDKRANEIFYNDELAILLNQFEADSTNARFTAQRQFFEGFLNMRNVLRDSRCWGFVFDLVDSEVHKRLGKNMDLTFAEGYDIGATKSLDLLKKMIRLPASDDIYSMRVTPGQVLEGITEFGHRRSNSQNYWPLARFIAFAEAAMLRRLTQLEIASAQDLSKYIDPMGEVQLGAAEELEKLIGWHKDIYAAHRSVLGEISNLSYMEKMTQLRLELARQGLLRNWTNAMRGFIERARDTESLQWTQQRDVPLQQLAGFYEEIADGYDESGFTPVKSWQVVDVVVDGYKIKRDNLLIQSLNRIQLALFFDEMGLDESGEAMGGARKIKLKPLTGDSLREAPENDSATVKDERFTVNDNDYLVEQIFSNREGKWFRLSMPNGESLGWINENLIEYSFDIKQSATDPMRPGEVIFEGGRLVWQKGRSGWQWDWVPGNWSERLSDDGMRRYWEFMPGGNFERRLELGVEGVSHSINKLKGTPFEVKDKSTLQRKKSIGGKMVRIQPANYPLGLKFKSEKHREYFYNLRAQTLLSLLLGRPIGAEPGTGYTPDSPRQAGAALPQNMFVNRVADFTQLLQFGDWVTKQMRSTEMYAACRGALIKTLKGWFNAELLASEIAEQRVGMFEFMMQGRVWDTDRETLERFVKETSQIAFIRQGNKPFRQRLKESGERTRETQALRTKAWWYRLQIKASQANIGDKVKINLPTLVVEAFLGAPQLIWATILNTTAWWLTWWTTAPILAGGYLAINNLAIQRWGAKAASKIDPDISDANLPQFTYLREHNAYVPVE